MTQALSPRRFRAELLLLGLGCQLIYLLFFVRQFPLLHYGDGPYLDMGQITAHARSQFWSFLLEFAVLFLLTGAAWRLVEDRRVPACGCRSTLWLVLGFGALFGVTMSFVYPVTANDVFSYVEQSVIMVQYHQNPIATPPAAFPHDPLMQLSGGWSGFGAPYGPLGLVIDALPTLLVGRSLLANLILLKLMFSAMTLICAYLVHGILQHVRPRSAVSGALLVAWNPLLLFEISANGHNDIAMMLFVLAALLFVAEREWTVAAALLLASALVKYASILLLPPLLVYALARQTGWRRRIVYLLSSVPVMVAIAALAYAPFWYGLGTFRRALFENQLYLYSFSSVLHDLFLNGLTSEQATVLGRLLFVPVYLYGLRLAARDLTGLLIGCFLTLFAFLALASNNVKYWYVIWPSVLAAATPSASLRLAVLVMGYGVELAAALNVYVWKWVGVTADNFRPINNASYLIIFLLPVLLLAARALRGRLVSRFLPAEKA